MADAVELAVALNETVVARSAGGKIDALAVVQAATTLLANYGGAIQDPQQRERILEGAIHAVRQIAEVVAAQGAQAAGHPETAPPECDEGLGAAARAASMSITFCEHGTVTIQLLDQRGTVIGLIGLDPADAASMFERARSESARWAQLRAAPVAGRA